MKEKVFDTKVANSKFHRVWAGNMNEEERVIFLLLL